MLQLLQSLRDGRTVLEDVPAPGPGAGVLLIQTTRSLVSAGTERMLLNFGRASWLGKIRQQPEKVRSVLSKVRAEGPLATWKAVSSKLNQPIPLGYCHVGRVIDTGGADGVRIGERVVSNGPHAQVVSISQGMCTKIPDGVDDESAIFTPLASVALEGINLLDIKPGDKVVVTGLGLIGQLAVRILKTAGCDVMGFDPSAERRKLAERFGARVLEDEINPVSAALSWSNGHGVRGVLITASASSHDLVSQAARSCEYRGKVVLVGVVGLQLNRADFYNREVMFQVSCSYGSRDPRSPHSAQRNFQQVLEWMAAGRLTVADLITHRSAFATAPVAYAALDDPQALGIVLEYEDDSRGTVLARTVELQPAATGTVAVIGAGNFAVRTLLPALVHQRPLVAIDTIVSERGQSAAYAAKTFSAARATTDTAEVLNNAAVSVVFVATRHDGHAAQACAALTAGKHVWVEKPLALSLADLEAIEAMAGRSGKLLMVGFNRRFAPMAAQLQKVLANQPGPLRLEIQVNAGRLDREHWALDPRIGGGRIVGEGCHFIDLIRFLVGAPIVEAHCQRRDIDGQDGGCFELEFGDGSKGMIDYRTDLAAHVPKELITVSGHGFAIRIHNWSRVTVSGLPGMGISAGWLSEPCKGHREAVHAFFDAIRMATGSPIPLPEILEVSRWAVRLQALDAGQSVNESANEN